MVGQARRPGEERGEVVEAIVLKPTWAERCCHISIYEEEPTRGRAVCSFVSAEEEGQ